MMDKEISKKIDSTITQAKTGHPIQLGKLTTLEFSSQCQITDLFALETGLFPRYSRSVDVDNSTGIDFALAAIKNDWSLVRRASTSYEKVTFRHNTAFAEFSADPYGSSGQLNYVGYEDAPSWIVEFFNSKKEDARPEFHLVGTSASGGLKLMSFNTKNLNDFDLTQSYNDDTVEFDRIIKKKLNDGVNGIVLLHGEPGCGKTTYLRHLISSLDREVVYIPPELATQIASPSFIPFMIQQCRSKVIFIEDAENILLTREGGGNQAVANLLNISDGLLGDALNIQLVCTFNTKLTDIDSALRRPGRLLGEHRFEKLSYEKALALARQLFADGEALLNKKHHNKSISLAELYGLGEVLMTSKKVEQTVGFIPQPDFDLFDE